MRLSRKMILAMTAVLLLNSVPVPAFGQVIQYTPTNTPVTVVSKENTRVVKDEEYGPGHAGTIDESEIEEVAPAFEGPTVKKVNLQETYHELYDTYEESISDMFFLYTSVANGGLTHEPVTIDIPANVNYIMEKDGLPYPYESRQYVSAKGTYVLRLTAVENTELPLSEQTEYQAVFRFRIQDKPVVSETEGADGYSSQGSTSAGTSSGGSLWGNDMIVPEPSDVVVDVSAEMAAAAESLKEQETEVSSEAVEEKVQDKESDRAEEETLPNDKDPVSTVVSRIQTYDTETRLYKVTLENGKEITSSVPEGYVGSGSVELNLSESDIASAVLYRNDEPASFTNGVGIAETGVYRLELGECSFHFTIAQKVNAMDYYPAPTGMRFTKAFLDDSELQLESDRYVRMGQDGGYSISMVGESGNTLDVYLVKDTEAPKMNLTSNGNQAQIQYISDDITTIRLMKDGEVVEGFKGSVITDPGRYELTVADDAGNKASASFVLKYQINMYGILALVLGVLVIAGIVAFAIHTKKNMKIR